jgi:hypothetical protein
MSAPQSDSILPGVLIVLVLLPILYGIGRAGAALGDVWSAHLLAPLAPMVGGNVERSRRRLVGTYTDDVSPSRVPSARASLCTLHSWRASQRSTLASTRAS